MLLVRAGDLPAAALCSREELGAAGVGADRATLLGWFRGARCVLLDLSDVAHFMPPPGTQFAELRPLAPRIESDEAGLLAYARALQIWRQSHRHCSACAAPTTASRAGHVLVCSNPDCRREAFPRIDPAIIVLVSDGDRALLGRQASWPRGRYSTIAGFVEPGESLEDAVAREVYEESGVEVDAVHYHSSQPWPFPSSLMLGFHATARPGSMPRGSDELEDVRWFSRADIANGQPIMPPSVSISYRLIESWFNAGSDIPLANQQRASHWRGTQ